MAKDTLLIHSLSANTLSNATKFSHHSIQGHHHGTQGVERFADKGKLRWSMSVGCLLDPHSPAARYGSKNVFKRPILGCGMLIGPKGNTLLVPDLHLPYQHPEAFDFLAALHEYYQFKRILNVGDVFDHHRPSFHESETDALNPEDEFYMAKADASYLQEMFPEMIITIGNHDAIPVRQAKTIGLPMAMLCDTNKIYDLKATWKWVDQLWFDSWGSYPITVPMVLTKRGAWDGRILEL
jgi:hypothetical protein|tara:strand:- start:369 stop:1082 length:714 start_codon:yes stop_codon:yes gene_type:complete